MNQETLVRAHVENTLMTVMDNKCVCTDQDGDYPFRWNTAACWIHVESSDAPAIRVFAHAAFGLKRSAKLLQEINDINTGHRFVKTSLVAGTVVVEYAMPWAAAEPSVISSACKAVGSVAADAGPLLAGVFGGQTPFEPETESQDEQSA